MREVASERGRDSPRRVAIRCPSLACDRIHLVKHDDVKLRRVARRRPLGLGGLEEGAHATLGLADVSATSPYAGWRGEVEERVRRGGEQEVEEDMRRGGECLHALVKDLRSVDHLRLARAQ